MKADNEKAAHWGLSGKRLDTLNVIAWAGRNQARNRYLHCASSPVFSMIQPEAGGAQCRLI